MRIIIVSAFFYPEVTPRAFRTTELVKEFVRRGHEVSLYIPNKDYCYDDFLKEYPISIKFYESNHNEIIKGSSIYKKILRRCDYYLDKFFMKHYIKMYNNIYKELSKEKNCDLLISIAFPHMIHWSIAKLFSNGKIITKCWCADCGDPFMGNQIYWYPPYFAYFEKKFCRYADFITIPVESSRNAYYPEFHSKIKIVPQGFDFNEDFSDMTIKRSEKKSFAYAGHLYAGHREMIKFIVFLSKLNEDFEFHIFNNNKKLMGRYKEILKEKLIVHDYVDRKKLISFLKTMDFVVNVENRGTVQVPSKLIDYCLSKRPILSVSDYDFNEIIAEEFIKGNYKHGLKLKNIEQFNIKNVVDNFIKLYQTKKVNTTSINS